ncbi:MAG: NusG domain II-containing protein [Coprobacillus sp.]
MKKKDIIVILVLCAILGIGYFVFDMFQGKKETVNVYYKNEKVDTIDITKDETYTYKGSYGKFTIEVKEKKYHAVNVECPNHDCEKIGWVKDGSSLSIVCAPNEMYVIQEGAGDVVK